MIREMNGVLKIQMSKKSEMLIYKNKIHVI